MALAVRLSPQPRVADEGGVLSDREGEEAPFCSLPCDYFAASLHHCDNLQRRVLCEIKRLDGSLLYRVVANTHASPRLSVVR